jgi:hypothetical protein
MSFTPAPRLFAVPLVNQWHTLSHMRVVLIVFACFLLARVEGLVERNPQFYYRFHGGVRRT